MDNFPATPSFLNQVYFGNTLLDYLVAAVIIVLGISLVRLFKRTLLRKVIAWTGKTHTHIDDFIVGALERFGIPALYLLFVFLGLNYLALGFRGEAIMYVASTVAITFLVVRLISTTILAVLQGYMRRQERGEEKVKQLGGLMLLINAFIWIIGLLFLFDNMGYSVTTIITGLGIGGIAVALAAQNILGDLFNYFVIFFDRPFEIGDSITVDEKSGTVDFIGIKTTRIKSTTGEQLVFSNSDLTSSRIHNHKRMERRRIAFGFGVVYQTPYEQLEQIPELVKQIVNRQDQVLFDRAHFKSYGDSALNFEVVYHILSSDYGKYMDAQQAINLAIFKEFQNRKIEFAYPTRTLLVVPQEKEG